MKPLTHARRSVSRLGGKWEDYIEIHEWIDQTKAHVPDMRHRMILHNSWGIYLCQQFFGVAITNSDGQEVAVRAIAEQHILDDLGFIPTLSRCLEDVELRPGSWLGGKVSNKLK